MSRKFPRTNAETVAVDGRLFNQIMDELERLGRFRVSPPLSIQSTPAGMHLDLKLLRETVWAQLTEWDSVKRVYAWVEVRPSQSADAGDVDVWEHPDGGRSGTTSFGYAVDPEQDGDEAAVELGTPVLLARTVREIIPDSEGADTEEVEAWGIVRPTTAGEGTALIKIVGTWAGVPNYKCKPLFRINTPTDEFDPDEDATYDMLFPDYNVDDDVSELIAVNLLEMGVNTTGTHWIDTGADPVTFMATTIRIEPTGEGQAAKTIYLFEALQPEVKECP